MAIQATLIGDVVASRAAADRADLHRVLSAALDEVNTTFRPTIPLRITLGDEYQGAFADLGSAARAALALTVRIADVYDVRHGLGWGEVTELQQEPRVEDGPGWWAARAAIETVHDLQQRPATGWVRTRLKVASQSPLPPGMAGAFGAALSLRDQAIARLSPRAVSVLRGLLDGETQREIAERLQISPSAVSQRIRTDGLGALVVADQVWASDGEASPATTHSKEER
ncbi:SatD family protein [Nocardioides sp. Bht2]|uniref:SatD family protein n=1 Tax=Nocardioides sp. Bht2 TaxID=3392297 RepID=UPI0039B376A0